MSIPFLFRSSIVFVILCSLTTDISAQDIRFATYNIALYRQAAGQLKTELDSGGNKQVRNVGAVIQHTRPDVLVLCEFDYDPSGKTLDAFCQQVLEVSQNGQETINYPYRYQVPTNTGFLAPVDINGDGKKQLPEDAYGYGRYEGQYAFAVLSKYPLMLDRLRTFQTFKWKEMPGAMQVTRENETPWYPDSVMQHFRLSSKNHLDLPVRFPGNKIVHILATHPTPPGFDGKEDRNGKRNFDEIRLLADLISGKKYLHDDNGKSGGLAPEASFVVLGDLNADPIDGDSWPGAMRQLLEHPRVNPAVALGDLVPTSQGGAENDRREKDQNDPKYDTAFFGLRIDYALPSSDLSVSGTGMFWPGKNEKYYNWISDRAASDHVMVWVDISLK